MAQPAGYARSEPQDLDLEAHEIHDADRVSSLEVTGALTRIENETTG